MKSDVDYHILELDEGSSLLFLAGNHHTFLVDRDLGSRLRDGFERLTPAEREEWTRLTEEGLVSDDNRQVLATSTFDDGANLAMNVNLTNLCNLACTYCFASGGDYGRITSAMGSESVDHIFAFIREHVTSTRVVRLELFGGEPLANFPVMREICERARSITEAEGIRFIYRISTNLTLLPEGVLDLFRTFGFIVSVSIDGGRAIQDANRPTKSGKGSFDRILSNVRRVRDASDEIVLVARMTVAQREPSLLESVRELWSLDLFDYFQIYPGVFPVDPEPEVLQIRRKGAATKSGECSPPAQPARTRYVNFFLQDGMVDQFRDLLAEYPRLFSPANRFKGVLEYERTVQMVLEGALALSFCSGGRTYFTHSPDTSITSCHRLVGEPSFDVGTGPEGLTRPPDDWRRSVEDHPVCGHCWARYVCGGGCKQENYVATGNISLLNDESCRYQLLLTEEALRMMAKAGPAYRGRDRRRFDDLFVSCGRPVVRNGRTESTMAASTNARFFRPLSTD